MEPCRYVESFWISQTRKKIIVLSFDHRVCFIMNIFGKWSELPFSRMSRILFAAKQGWTTLLISRPSFVGSYLQVTWWAFANEKEEKFAAHDNLNFWRKLSNFYSDEKCNTKELRINYKDKGD